MKQVYSAGCLSYYFNNNKFEKATIWRDEASKKLKDINIKVFNPSHFFNENLQYNSKGIPYQNLYYLQNCDFVLINLNELNESPGTIFELAWCFILKKPVIAFGNTIWRESPHIKESITVQFETLNEALDYISTMYNQ